jgi:3-phenylpropionate/cinnamic acid dioxygenase small subunit
MKTAILPHTELHGRVVEFLNREAELLDSYRFTEWLDTLSPDIRYRMPVRTTQFLPDGDGFHHDFDFIDDDFATLETRVKRLETEFAWAETPPSRTRHFVSNVIVESDLDDAGVLEVRSGFLITRTRADLDYQMFTGLKDDRLIDGEDGLQVASRTILIDQTAITSTNLSIFF